MNILFVSSTPFHPFRGVGRVTDTLIREFPKRGYQVFYMHLSWYMEESKKYGYGYGYGADHGRRKNVMSSINGHTRYPVYLEGNLLKSF